MTKDFIWVILGVGIFIGIGIGIGDDALKGLLVFVLAGVAITVIGAVIDRAIGAYREHRWKRWASKKQGASNEEIAVGRIDGANNHSS